MKRILLWAANLLLLMTLSSTYAAPEGVHLKALSLTELNSVTAGICRTCPPPPPPPRMVPVGEGWELWNSFESAIVETGRQYVGGLANTTSVPQSFTESYNDECRFRVTGGGASLGASLGISFNQTYSCAKTRTVNITVPPRTTVTLYKATWAYYVTDHYRHVIYYSDGQQERTGLTEVTRTEHSIAVLGVEEN